MTLGAALRQPGTASNPTSVPDIAEGLRSSLPIRQYHTFPSNIASRYGRYTPRASTCRSSLFRS
eukprot:1435542-Rhodomonas_salina.1